MMNKRGQFFLIAALVVILTLTGLNTVYNSINVSPEDNTAKNLAREMNTEMKQIIDNGFYTQTIGNITSRINHTLNIYSSLHPDAEFALFYGSQDDALSSNLGLRVYHSVNNTKREIKYLSMSSIGSNQVKITLDEGDQYLFNTTQGQNLYIIVKIKNNQERIVSTN